MIGNGPAVFISSGIAWNEKSYSGCIRKETLKPNVLAKRLLFASIFDKI